MSNNILRDIFKFKMGIIEALAENLPPVAKERVDRLHQDFLVAFSEIINEHLGGKKPEDEGEGIKPVLIE